MLWATEFKEIPTALAGNVVVRERMFQLACTCRMPGKVTEGAVRIESFRRILCDLITGSISLSTAIARTERDLCETSSAYRGNRRVFCADWAQRLVRTQFSRFYNQAVIQILMENGEVEGVVAHSSQERPDSQCSQMLAGGAHPLDRLLQRLLESYEQGYWNIDVKIPDHPHCTHVVKPFPRAEERLAVIVSRAVAS